MKADIIDRLSERLKHSELGEEQSFLLHLVREKSSLDTIFNTIREGIVVLDEAYDITYHNQAAQELLGLTNNAKGQALTKFVPELKVKEMIPSENGFKRQELEISYPEFRHLICTIVKQTEIDGYIIVIHDNTDLHNQSQSQNESEQLRLLTMLAAGVAHELGNPLNSLNIHLQLLGRLMKQIDGDEGDEARDLLNVASGEIDRLDTIIRQFLGALRSDKPEMKALELSSILREAIEFMSKEIEGRNIELEISIPERTPTIEGDETQLKQAFFNIMKNAIQAMPQGGKLALICSGDDDFIHISFADNGGGIDLNKIGKIFNSYQSDRHSGTGLGIFIVEKIIREHGGRLDISSAEDKGTILTISLPRLGKRIRMISTKTNQEISDE
jgi:two-component system, sporulation sensor kinase E